jgi:3-oxoadipate enol-lactonase
MIARINGCSIAYDEAGSGMPLLLLHAFPLGRRMWSAQLCSLGGEARCIAPDMRGFGQSEACEPYSMAQYADDAAALLDSLDITEPAVVCGVSMGGYIAFEMWRRHHGRIRALILCDTRAGADSEEGRAGRAQTIELVREQGLDDLASAQIPRMLSARTRERSPDSESELRAMVTAASPDGVVGATQAMRDRPDSTATLDSISVPTLVIVGKDDTLTPPSESELIHRAIAGSRIEQVEGAAHLPPVERPAAFTGIICEFIASLR